MAHVVSAPPFPAIRLVFCVIVGIVLGVAIAEHHTGTEAGWLFFAEALDIALGFAIVAAFAMLVVWSARRE